MKKELGKWFMDVAKYMATALLLSSVFNSLQNIWVYIGVIIAMVISLFIGLTLVRDKKEE